MKIRTRDGIFEVIEIRSDYFLNQGWKKYYVVQEENEKCFTLWPEELVLEVIE